MCQVQSVPATGKSYMALKRPQCTLRDTQGAIMKHNALTQAIVQKKLLQCDKGNNKSYGSISSSSSSSSRERELRTRGEIGDLLLRN